ncbi:MAG: hypothetical protein BMS9Abin01_2139 [Gammaproteobacteria bacterium]|nr:MAG: hypothetical protein BMS9Abin01_2139 [Gammaproteobacteria bacterium]
MPRVISVLQMDHQNVAVLLQLLDPLASKLGTGTPADFVPILDIMNYMCSEQDARRSTRPFTITSSRRQDRNHFVPSGA